MILSLSRMVDRRWAITRAEPFFISLSSACCTKVSFVLSSALVASSSRMTSGRRIIARAIASLWRWPPERLEPPLEIIVSSLSGLSSMKSHALASLHAWMTISSVTPSPMP
mmetsp:Transcript_16056/g.29263  ORF Transcript_16056/g.29263 Transcript_16056/m.29263 type:complete len:111 (-) Transcript_16056:515-847(-)